MNTEEVNNISDIVGQWGKWQRNLFLFCIVVGIFGATNNLGHSFYSYDVEYFCDDVPLNFTNKTHNMKCNKFFPPNETCTKWKYDESEFKSTIISEFDLVCDRKFIASLTQSCYMFGIFISGIVFGYYSDKYGRRPIIWVAFTLEIISGFSSTFSVNVVHYAFSRFLLGLSSSGSGLAFYTLMVECVGPKYRSSVSILGDSGWVIGYVALPGIAYWLRHFRYIQLFITILIIPVFICFYFMFESPRWQLINGHLDEAEKTLRKALKQNGKSDEGLREKLVQFKILLEKNQTEEELKQKKTIIDLLRYPNMRKNAFILWYSFAVISFVYYGISLNIGDFGGNFYINFMIAGLVEVPSMIFSVIGLRFIGRKTLTSANVFATGLASLAIIPFMNSTTIKISLVMVAKFCINSAFCIVYLQAAEIFPTILRQTGIGYSSVAARIGSILAPFVKEFGQETSISMVMLFYGLLCISCGTFLLILPETKDKEIPDTMIEAENLKFKNLNDKNSQNTTL